MKAMDDWREAPISKSHDRDAFDCGEPALNDFLRRHARQSHDSGGAKTFVATPPREPARVLGFYSLSPASIDFARTPALVRKGLARHDVPVFRLGRLAVDLTQQGHGLGGALLLAAGRRCLRAAAEVGGVALLIDAKSDRAVAWYASYGAVALLDAPRSLVLPLAVIDAVLTAAIAAHSRTSMNQTVADLIRRALAQPATPVDAVVKALVRVDKATGLPTVRSPRPVSAEDVRALEDD